MTEAKCCRTYRCRACGKTSPYLSASWSTVTVGGRTMWHESGYGERTEAVHWHTCLECRTAREPLSGPS